METITKILISALIILVLTLKLIALGSAMTITSVDASNFQLGSEQDITLKVKNTLSNTAEGVSLALDISKVPFSVLNSEDDVDEIDEDDSENFNFELKASNDAKAGTYQIPYVINYKINNASQIKQGTFALTIEANPELVYSASAENPVVNSKGKVTLKIVNKGFGDAKFVSVKIIPNRYTLISEDNFYIGTISSDDYETISFDVLFKSQNPSLNAEVEYKDFNNKKIAKTISLPLVVYTQERAIELGIIKKNNNIMYGIGIVILFVIWLIVRKIRKKRRMNRAREGR